MLDGVRRIGRVALAFHPDRIAADGRSVVDGLVADGIYRSQFETRISAGSRTAFVGGERDAWEHALFGDAYRGAPDEVRPRYGALDLLGHADGPSPRFGSCFLVLRPAVLQLSTFCFGDSHAGPADIGTIDAFEPVLAALFEAAAAGSVLGRDDIGVADLVGGLAADHRSTGGVVRALDHYIEAQVHAVVDVGRDAEGLVVDPSFAGTPTGDALAALADRHGLALSSHPGFEIEPGEIPDAFRGPAVPHLARRICIEHRSARIDAELLGRAARSLPDDDQTLQHVKQIWHAIVQFGQPRPT